ncbi:MAG TPA: hypothetical protein VJC21_01055 [Candidatus Nanoarchaeia archaeon]|nr:hypothetical protein [Candidatus Nanoarchaeia archaeon]
MVFEKLFIIVALLTLLTTASYVVLGVVEASPVNSIEKRTTGSLPLTTKISIFDNTQPRINAESEDITSTRWFTNLRKQLKELRDERRIIPAVIAPLY